MSGRVSFPDPVDKLVAQCLLRLDMDGEEAVDEVCAQHPQHVEAIRRRIALLRDAGLADVDESASGAESDRIGAYVLEEEIGRGGQGIVYRAKHARTGQTVAVKVLRNLGPGAAKLLLYFKREAEIAAKLDHPGLCPLYDAGESNGVAYLAMRYLSGETLAERIATTRDAAVGSLSTCAMLEDTEIETASSQPEPTASPSGPSDRPALMKVVRLFEKTARALHAAHEAGIIHRDIKPGNVMITSDGEAVIMDFGLSRDDDSDLETLTRTGDLFGTPAYMSPEQLTRQTIRLDRRTDVWSLGVSLYECLTLKRPFEAPTREGLYQRILAEEPSDPRRANPGIARDLATVVLTTLAKNRDRRYQTALDLAEDLRRVREHEPIVASRVPGWRRLALWARRKPAVAALVVLIPILTSLGGFVLARLPELAEARTIARRDAYERLVADATELGADSAAAWESRRLLERAVEMDPDAPVAFALLAYHHAWLGQSGKARQLLSSLGDDFAPTLAAQVIESIITDRSDVRLNGLPEPRSVVDHLVLGLTYAALANKSMSVSGRSELFGKALRPLETAVHLSERPTRNLLSTLVRVLAECGETDRVDDLVSVILKRWPDASSSCTCAMALSAAGQPARGLELYGLARAAGMKGPELDHNEGYALYKLGRYEESVVCYRRAVEANPEWPLARDGLAQLLGITGQIEESLEHSAAAMRLMPSSVQAAVTHSTSLGILGRNEEAKATLEPLLTDDNRNVSAWSTYAHTLVRLGRPEAAERAADRALQIDGTDRSAQLVRGLALLDQERCEEARKQLSRLVQSDPNWGMARVNLGVALARSGQYLAALPHYERGFADDARDLRKDYRFSGGQLKDMHVARGWTLLKLGRFEEAAETCSAVIAEAEAHTDAHQVLLQSLRELLRSGRRDPDRANPEAHVAVVKKAVSLTKEQDPVILHLLAIALAANDDPGQAVTACEKALKLIAKQDQPDAQLQADVEALQRRCKRAAGDR